MSDVSTKSPLTAEELREQAKRVVAEMLRTEVLEGINSSPRSREGLEEKYGQVWDTQQLQEDFVVHGFMAPFIHCTRKSDNVEGSMYFQHNPRFYFGFLEHSE